MVLLLASLLGSLLFSGLFYFQLISYTHYKNILFFYSFLIYIFTGLYLGKKTVSRLIISISFTLLFILILSALFQSSFNDYLWLSLKFLLLFISAFLIYQKK